MSCTLMWFRRDLRLADNPALAGAVAAGRPVVAVFIDPAARSSAPGAASRAWLEKSLASLDASLRARGNRLVIRTGDAAVEITRIAAECSAREVFCSRDWTPESTAEEDAVAAGLAAQRRMLRVLEGQLLVTPVDLVSAAGLPYRVFTPFSRQWLAAWRDEEPLGAPEVIPASPLEPPSAGPLSTPAGAPEVARWWTPGETGAQERLHAFSAHGLKDYGHERDFPALDGTSRLSPRLAWGELSPRQVANSALSLGETRALPFLRQLAWREFTYHVLHHFPESLSESMDARFAEFPWRDDPVGLEAWKAGRTGYTLVDAGMRQLAASGWIHNRVRMLCASFLTKDLLVPWQTGEEYFRERLVDYDPAINAFNWQWVAGSGLDAAPYFRVFSPRRQADRFDPDGAYQREWLAPFETELAEPIVDHAEARRRALAAFSAISRLPRSRQEG